jgi:hypothetical protein
MKLIHDLTDQARDPVFSTLPDWARAATDCPDAFWDQQRLEIRRRLATAPRRSSMGVLAAWAGAWAVVVLAIALLRTTPTPQASVGQNDSDQELLVGVEQTLQRGGPQALEPAAMLAEEISNNPPISTSRSTLKENRNENQ